MNDYMQIAETIRTQLGGQRFMVMTGAKDFVAFDAGLRFKLPRGFARNGINLVSIKLEANDTYTVLFQKFYKLNVTTVATVENVYADSLRAVFTEATGLDVNL